VPANVRALAGQSGAVGKAMVHQNAETLAVEPSHGSGAASVVKSGYGGGFQRDQHGYLEPI